MGISFGLSQPGPCVIDDVQLIRGITHIYLDELAELRKALLKEIKPVAQAAPENVSEDLTFTTATTNIHLAELSQLRRSLLNEITPKVASNNEITPVTSKVVKEVV